MNSIPWSDGPVSSNKAGKGQGKIKQAMRVETIDMHTGGEPLRVVVGGYPKIEGKTVLEKRRYCLEHLDRFRQLLMLEPRGHADMYGCLLIPPNDEGADFGVIFIHNEGYSTMCGHAVIALSRLVFEQGWISPEEGSNELKIDAPCGRISSFVEVEGDRIKNIRFAGVPSFVVGLDRKIRLEGIGEIHYDLAYGGAFYAYVDLDQNTLDLSLNPEDYNEIIRLGKKIKQGVINGDKEIEHPFEQELSFLYGTIFTEKSSQEGVDSRNVCVFADGEVDRCPTGSGVSGRMAIEQARKTLPQGEVMRVQSITDSLFLASYTEVLDYGPFKAVIPQVSGMAHVTGMHTFVLDPEDPIQNGFLFR